MSDNNITRVSRDELKKIPDLTDWERVKAMSSIEVEANAQADPDCQPTDEGFWDDATVVRPAPQGVSQSS